MSDSFPSPMGLTDDEAVRFDDLERRSTVGLTDAEVAEYEALKPRALGTSRQPAAAGGTLRQDTAEPPLFQPSHEQRLAMAGIQPAVPAEWLARRKQQLTERPPLAQQMWEGTGLRDLDERLGTAIRRRQEGLVETLSPSTPMRGEEMFLGMPGRAVGAAFQGALVYPGALLDVLGEGPASPTRPDVFLARGLKAVEEAPGEAIHGVAKLGGKLGIARPETTAAALGTALLATPLATRGGRAFLGRSMKLEIPPDPAPFGTKAPVPFAKEVEAGPPRAAPRLPVAAPLRLQTPQEAPKLPVEGPPAGAKPPGGPGVPPSPGSPPEGPTYRPGQPSRGFLEGGGRWDRLQESLREFGPEGEMAADKLGILQETARRYEGSAITDLDLAHKNLPWSRRPTAEKKLMDWVEREEATPPWAEEFVAAARKATEQNALNTKDAGLMIQDPRSGWRYMNPQWEEAFPHRIKKEIRDALRRENQPDHQGPTPYTDRFMAENSDLPNPWRMEPVPEGGPAAPQVRSSAGFYAGAEKPRVYKIPRDFFAEDTYQSLRSHIHRTSLDAAENKVFKQTTTNPETGFSQKTGGDLQRLYDRLAQREGSHVAEKMKRRVERLLERNPEDVLSEGAKAINRFASNLTVLGKLAGSPVQIVQQTSQLGNQLIAGGIRPVAAGIKGMAQKGREATITEARKTGRITPDAYRRSMDIETEGTGTRLTRKTTALASATQIPQSWMDTTFRGIAAEGAPARLSQIREGLTKGGRQAAWAEREMTRLDVPAEYKTAIREGRVTPEVENYIGQRWTATQNIESGITEFPRIYGEGVTGRQWMPLRQLKSFQIGQTRWFAENVVKETLHGNVKPLLRWAVISQPLGELVMGVREAAGGPVENRKSLEEIAEDLLKGDVRSLAYRLGQNVVAGGTPGYGGPILAFTMSNEKRIDDLLRNLTPPIASDVYALGKGAVKAAFGDTAEDKARKAAEKGRIYRYDPEEDRKTQLGVALKAAGQALKDILPQIRRNTDTIRLWFSQEYRRKEMQKVRTLKGTPRKGRELRFQRLRDIETVR